MGEEIFGPLLPSSRGMLVNDIALHLIVPSHSQIEETILNLKRAQADLDELFYQEEIKWAQRSRVNLLKAGNKNTRFFHQQAS
ncbi:hypothetical protein Ahy_B10g101763 [Arachis hypogaea]|uniref:Uncharacterized protein n=1 Tax=Arachis hypogaea TaxID=3818 RepID=A0A444X0L5_ARAHY|nr:hypothetical protein Ahy_B10g101763 [Arachis hypogaea]